MKLIKKIAAIMFAFTMVVSMSCNVKAAGTGKITINPANPNEEYKIYKILKLESYDETKRLYSYTKTGDKWDTFIDSAVREGYLENKTDEYVTFSKTKNSDADVREFARKALAYATEQNITATSTKTTGANDTSATIDGLDLGYYLVGSSMGALCSLDTAHPEATIRDKNEKPTVDKKIVIDENAKNYTTNNSVNIGDPVEFKITINVKPGAKNYILHDKMDSHLEFSHISSAETNLGNKLLMQPEGRDIELKQSGFNDDCTFEVSFTNKFYETYREQIDSESLKEVTINYVATVKDDAVINEPMKNTTHLTYGDKSTVTKESETITKTFGIHVFKYTGENTALEGAQFILSTDPDCAEDAKTLKFKLNTADKYRYDETTGNTVLTSLSTGRIDIEGLKAGTYYLKETKAPKGYNLLKAPVEIRIDSDGNIYVGDSTTVNNGDVRVQNKSGTLLPSTGGAGTTMIYLVGALLVLGSGVVLASKRKSNSK